MYFFIKHFQNLLSVIILFSLISCKLQEPSKNHGIIFLENRSEKLFVNKTNQNDVIKIVGNPHWKSINNEFEWVYIERVVVKGEFHKLGQNVLKTNNVLVLNFDKYGVLKKKAFFNKDDIKKLNFSEDETDNQLSQKSFIEKFLNSIKAKMYGNN